MTARVTLAIEKIRQVLEVFFGRRLEFDNLEIRWRRDREFNLDHFDLFGSVGVIQSSGVEKLEFDASVAINDFYHLPEPASIRIISGLKILYARWNSTNPKQVGVIDQNLRAAQDAVWWIGTSRDDRRQERFYEHYLVLGW